MLKFLVFAAAVFVPVFCEQNGNFGHLQHHGGPLKFSQCPPNWEYISEHEKCIIATPKPLSWHKTKDFCQSIGAHLISLHGKDEIQQVFEIVKEKFWTGFYKKENTWRFVNNETVHYVPLTDYNTSECALGFADSLFARESCATKMIGICQKYLLF